MKHCMHAAQLLVTQSASVKCISLIFSILILGCWGCGSGVIATSLGGDTAGSRGTVRVLFINNTPHRALLTAGTYDPADQNSQPDFIQFSADPLVGTLEGDRQSRLITLRCGRVFSVGGQTLLDLIERNRPNSEVDSDALRDGVGFSSAEPDGVGAGAATAGSAPPIAAQIGVDFACNSLLIVRLEIDDVGDMPFAIDFSYIPSESNR